MNRCLFRPLLSVSTALTVGVLALAATSSFNAAEAQSRRTFNDRAERGTIEFVSPPYVRLKGKDAQLSPGSRVYNAENRIVMANNVVTASSSPVPENASPEPRPSPEIS